MREHDPVEIVSIGGGMTASIFAAKILPGTSHRMVSIEQGPAQWTYPDFAHNHDALRFQNRFALMHDLRRSTWTWRPHDGAPSLPMRQYGTFNPASGLGGAMVHWTALTWRFPVADFNYRTHYTERYGADILPEEMTVQDWPIDYEDLEPWYDLLEHEMGVSGQAGNIGGQIIPGGNPFEGARERPYPLPPLAPMPFGQLFNEASSGLGMHPFPTPAGILSQGYTDPYGNTRAACLYCGFCTRYGCEVGAKASPLTIWLPPALETGRYEVRTHSTVLAIETGPDGLATGVRYLDQHGEEHFQPAEVVLASAFTLENIRLLMLSKSQAHPGGIGNDRGMLGRNYSYQAYYYPIRVRFPGERFNFHMGNGCTNLQIFDYNSDHFDHSELDFVGGARIFDQGGQREPIGTVGDHLDGFIDQGWGAEWKQRLSEDYNAIGAVGIEAESPSYADNFCDLDPTYTDAFGRPLLRITFDWHENEHNMWRFLVQRSVEMVEAMGTTDYQADEELGPFRIDNYSSTHPTGGVIMGSDPGDSVTTGYGQVWDTPNVFVTGAALFPQNPGANPTGTVGALALRTAQAVRDRYFDAPGELL